MIDLGKWGSEQYRVPLDEAPADATDPEQKSAKQR